MARIKDRSFTTECEICSGTFKRVSETLALNAAQEHEDKLGRPFRFECKADEIVLINEMDDGQFTKRFVRARVLECFYDQSHEPYYTLVRIDKDGVTFDDQLHYHARYVMKISPSFSRFSKVDQG